MPPPLAEQRELQRRFQSRLGAWIAWVPVLGFGLSAAGLVAGRTLARLGEPLGGFSEGMLWFGLLYFGLALALLLTAPFRLRPRVVPCFRRPLAEYGGASSAAFARGHGLYREIDALDALARATGVEPLSSYGFADEYYDQEVRWHPAASGLRTVAALRADPPSRALAPDVAADLEALASTLEIAAARGVEFSLALRLQRGDLQAAATQEARAGRFW